jgi:hypothetical protein
MADTVAAYWDASTEQKCDLDPAAARSPIWASSDVLHALPLPGGVLSNVATSSARSRRTPSSSQDLTQKVMVSKAAAYFVFGFGRTPASIRGPTSFLFIRDASS